MKNRKTNRTHKPISPQPLKYDVNIRHNRDMGVARISFLSGNKRVDEYHYCDSEELEHGDLAIVKRWMRKNHAQAVKQRRDYKSGLSKAKVKTPVGGGRTARRELVEA